MAIYLGGGSAGFYLFIFYLTSDDIISHTIDSAALSRD